MEEEKAAAYYDELTRKGEGAARFKQGLGFSAADTAPSRASAISSSPSSFLSNFVKASGGGSSSSPTRTYQFEKQAQLESVQEKLKKKPPPTSSGVSERISSRERRSPSRSRERDRERGYRRRSRSRERYRDRDGERERRRRRSRSRDRRSVRSVSPREKRRSEMIGRHKSTKEMNGSGGIDYSCLIDGYDNMTPAEKVKARMKHQLQETAEKDTAVGMGSGWERFEFDKDAPLDDEEIEVAEDDATLVKHIGQSFRFSAIEARREEQIKAAHDEAMFGVPTLSASIHQESQHLEIHTEVDNNKKESSETNLSTSLLSDKVLAKQQGSWRDRARKV